MFKFTELWKNNLIYNMDMYVRLWQSITSVAILLSNSAYHRCKITIQWKINNSHQVIMLYSPYIPVSNKRPFCYYEDCVNIESISYGKYLKSDLTNQESDFYWMHSFDHLTFSLCLRNRICDSLIFSNVKKCKGA